MPWPVICFMWSCRQGCVIVCMCPDRESASCGPVGRIVQLCVFIHDWLSALCSVVGRIV